MKFEKKLIKATFLKRLNRFEALVLLEGEEHLVHVPNTGRCRELLMEGAEIYLEDRKSDTRKTQYELIMVRKSQGLVSIDSQLPNKLAEEAVRLGLIKELAGYSTIKREVTYSDSRFDLFLKKDMESVEPSACCFVEVKGVTLEREGIAMFPDAPTERGTKHIHELVKAKKEGYGASLLFVIQLDFAQSFRPNAATDPSFDEAVRYAYSNGVELLAYSCTVDEAGVHIKNKINIEI